MNAKEVESALNVLEQAKKESFRAYRVQICECGECWTGVAAFPRTPCESGSDFEFIYSMNEIEKDIKKLKVGSSLYFQPIRDDSTSKGIITRIL